MRVAFLSVGDTSRLTGGYSYNARVIGGLRERGVEVDEVVPCGASREEQGTFGADPLPLHRRYDVIVVDAPARVVCTPYLDRWREDRPVLAMVHELQSVAGPPKDSGLEEVHERSLLRSDRLVTVSEHGASILKSRSVPPERISVVLPGSDGLAKGEERPPREGSSVRVLCIAQWIPRKGILDLVRAWRMRVAGEGVLEFIGETDADPLYADRVHEAIEEDPSIVIRGAVSDAEVRSTYLEADAFALPSLYEGYGVVYAEALFFGLPIIACDVGPVPEVVGEEAALLTPPGDVGALSKNLDRLIANLDLRERMSAAARRRAAELPWWEGAEEDFYQVVREVVHEGARSGRSGGDLAADARDDGDWREQNRRSWNAVVRVHDSHRGELARFLCGGGGTLFPEEERLLGDPRGKSLLHLQCNAGGDSLSLARMGAGVTGVDLSDAAIHSARDLSRRAAIPATFVRADLYDWLQEAPRRGQTFDIVFASYGVVCWLSDLDLWARGISGVLKPGGHFVLVDFHPAAEVFDHGWTPTRDYPSSGEPVPFEEGVGDYVGDALGGLTPAGFTEGERDFQNPEGCFLFRWGLGEVITALAGAGLRIERLEEYPYANGERHFDDMRELDGRRMVAPANTPIVPLMFGLRARK